MNLLLLLLTLTSHAADQTIVPTAQGLVQGKAKNGIISYKGIPFAKPPVGDLRWRAPEPASGWKDTFDASQYGPPCTQTENFNPNGKVVGSEDCLSVNVWKPEAAQGALPVMVFIYGGAFSWGSGQGRLAGIDLHDGSYLAEHGPAIVVTFNYRVGAFGFLTDDALDENGQSGNYGLMDQIAALRWVQQNIASFGGDPARVMIFGESAGGFSVLNLLTSPAAKGLFSRALIQSGSDIRATTAAAKDVGNNFSSKAGCAEISSRRDCLRSMTTTEVMKNTSALLRGMGAKLIFAPHIDGKILPDFPLRALRQGKYHQVPVVVGTNADEMSVLGLPILLEKPFFSRSDYEGFLRQELGQEVGDKAIEFYGKPAGVSSYRLLQEAFSDNVFHCPTVEMAEAIASRQPGQVWKYLFNHSYHLDFFKFLGAGHGLEVGYVFHNFSPWFRPSSTEQKLSEKMVGYWTRFAATGNPNGENEFDWETFTPNHGEYLEIDLPFQSKYHHRADACDFWRPHLNR